MVESEFPGLRPIFLGLAPEEKPSGQRWPISYDIRRYAIARLLLAQFPFYEKDNFIDHFPNYRHNRHLINGLVRARKMELRALKEGDNAYDYYYAVAQKIYSHTQYAKIRIVNPSNYRDDDVPGLQDGLLFTSDSGQDGFGSGEIYGAEERAFIEGCLEEFEEFEFDSMFGNLLP